MNKNIFLNKSKYRVKKMFLFITALIFMFLSMRHILQ